ncbi:MAG: T9SS type A sorting domain-containing protein [Fibrobacterales bacterium]
MIDKVSMFFLGLGGMLFANPLEKTLCVFDYDLTLSSHACPAAATNDNHCRTNTHGATYGWNDQCLGINAKEAVARCVANGAYISINSHAPSGNFGDKIEPIVSDNQFPEWLNAPGYNNPDHDPYYPPLDNYDLINGDDSFNSNDFSIDNINRGFYFMRNSDKMVKIAHTMRLIGMDPDNIEHRARVIFWDDSGHNIDLANDWGGIRAVAVDRLGSGNGADGGCGVTLEDIEEGWDGFVLYSSTESSSSELEAISSEVVSSSSLESSSIERESSSDAPTESSSELSSEEGISSFESSEQAESSEAEESSNDAESSGEVSPISGVKAMVTFEITHRGIELRGNDWSQGGITIYSMTGVMYYHQELYSVEGIIPLKGLSTGAYIAVVTNNHAAVSQAFLIK